MSTSFLILADGFEEIEAIGTLDILRRAGMQITTVSINPTTTVTGAHGVTVEADMVITDNMGDPDWVILPGVCPAPQIFQPHLRYATCFAVRCCSRAI